MNNKLGVDKAVELLECLRDTVSDFAARERELEQEFRVRMNKERQRREAAVEEQERQLATDIAEADAALAAAKESAETRFKARKSRITKARGTSKDRALERIDARIGAQKYELQKKMLQAERDREAGLAAAAAALKEFRGSLAAENEALMAAEHSARELFKGYGKFMRRLELPHGLSESEASPDEHQLLIQLRETLSRVDADLRRFRGFILPHVFKFLPLIVLASLIPILLVPLLPLLNAGKPPFDFTGAMEISGGCLAAVIAFYFFGMSQAGPLGGAIAKALGKARGLQEVCAEKSQARHNSEVARIKEEFKNLIEGIDARLKEAMESAADLRVGSRMKVDEKTVKVSGDNEAHHRWMLERLERGHHARVETLRRAAEVREAEFAAAGERNQARLAAENETRWRALETEWKSRIQPIYAAISSANELADELFPVWERQLLEKWTPPRKFPHAAKFARMEVNVDQLAGGLPQDPRLALPGPARFPLALLLTYPQMGSILLETPGPGREEMIGALNNIILRLLSTAPPGRLKFTILDPVGLGQNFAGVMHLADHEEQLINSRIWTQTSQIEERLAELNEHIEKVIQMYLRNEYATIADYNEQAGDIAEKYHFLVVADFPANFSDIAAKRLMSIAASGARCGVYTLIHWDHRLIQPQDFVADEFRKSSACIERKGNELGVAGEFLPGAKLTLELPPPPEFATEFIHKIGRSSRDSSRVEVPFSHVAPPDANLWSEDTTAELRVPIGRTGATKLQYLAIGKGTRQHALIAGKTGSGKSTLFHVMITNLALWCSPDQVEFYLVDFKKGVEFKCYGAKRLPHARVVAIESDREFGLSVLQRVDDELKRRGEMFRKLGVQDLGGYKRAGGKEPVPRSLLLIDEFQEFFVEDDKISQTASMLLDRIVRQGRAFGVHVVLGSQTLGGAYTVARTTLGQMVIRIALQCNESDAYLIMDDSNPAARLLSRPGEGIYNDSAGALEGNSPFQAVWLPDEVRDAYLDKVLAKAKHSSKNYPEPIVFEGDAPADVRENPLLRELLEAPVLQPALSARVWLGSPNSIKGPTEAVLQRQAGNNLLIVGQRDEAATAMLSLSLVALAAQYPIGAARFFVFHGSPPGTPQRDFFDRIVQAIPHEVRVARGNDLGEIMTGLVDDLKARTADEHGTEAPVTFLLFHGLQRYTKLRYEEDFGFSAGDSETAANPAAQLNSLILEGASHGFHVIATCDTYNNVNRFLGKKAFGEFEMRVLFQMSANDSANLIDSPKANSLGLHRALFYNEQEGYLEVFRPYALPDEAWIEEAQRNLARLLNKGGG